MRSLKCNWKSQEIKNMPRSNRWKEKEYFLNWLTITTVKNYFPGSVNYSENVTSINIYSFSLQNTPQNTTCQTSLTLCVHFLIAKVKIPMSTYAVIFSFTHTGILWLRYTEISKVFHRYTLEINTCFPIIGDISLQTNLQWNII